MSAAARTRPERWGCSSASSRVSHSSPAGEVSSFVPPPTTAGTPRSARAPRTSSACDHSPTRTATWRAAIGSPSHVASEASSAAMSPAQSAAMWRRASSARIRPRANLKPLRRTCRIRNGADEGAPASRDPGVEAVTSRTTIRSSPSAAPRSTTWRRSTRAGVAASVGVEGGLGGGGVGRREVGDDVAAAEGVDRLLRVADQDHRRVTGERAVEHLPLHRVGVLELVDQHDAASAGASAGGPVRRRRPARRRAGRAGRRRTGCRGGACGARPRRAPRRRTRPARRRPTQRGVRACRRVVGHRELGVRVADRGAGERERRRRANGGVVGGLPEAAEVDVVDDLDHELVEALDQGRAGVGVAGDAERAQHRLAELVGGRDGRGVEGRQRVAQPPVSPLDARRRRQRAGGRRPGVHGRRRPGRERALGLDQLFADPLAQLLARRRGRR